MLSKSHPAFPPVAFLFYRATENPGIPQDCRKSALKGDSFALSWNSQKQEKTSWLTFPFLRDLVLESKQPLSLRTGMSTMGAEFKTFCVQREKETMREMLGRNGWLRNKTFDKVRGTGSGHSLATFCKASGRAWLLLSLCLPCGLPVQMAQMSK